MKILGFLMMGCFLLVGTGVMGQTKEQEEFIRLYKENYLEWISSPEIARLQDRDPELKNIISEIPISETLAFKEALRESKEKKNRPFDFADVLGDGAMSVSMDVIKELLAEENTELIINMYWKVIKSAESKEIVDLIMPHVQKAKEEFRTAGVDVANTVRN